MLFGQDTALYNDHMKHSVQVISIYLSSENEKTCVLIKMLY